MRTLTREAVRKHVDNLIENNSETTTLEVKESLRLAGFWAIQHEVRNLMLDITSNDGDIEYIDREKGYRIYRKKSVAIPTDVNDSSDDDIVKIVTTTTIHRDYRPATYQVSLGDNNWYFTRTYTNVTRTQAKHQWAKETNQPYSLAKTCKCS